MLSGWSEDINQKVRYIKQVATVSQSDDILDYACRLGAITPEERGNKYLMMAVVTVYSRTKVKCRKLMLMMLMSVSD